MIDRLFTVACSCSGEEAGGNAVNRVSGWRFVKSAVVPDGAVLKLSCNRACSVNILIVAV